ncbi:LOW QUALITY PROTEIN: protein arginine N-methyltransferase 2-like [Haliotis rubra]|uniref:LOW QUALITY PROTEIN: protein arginine N-methyltransferase 2-like n=1 Tax=Haliotis rubra TaxID=36100 RepID=UPI001EE539A9|nr:LOW QUALITY PROTEIN: protein arginine N-methyltransferase 2-like [Haliotis rubra]
MEGGSLAHQQDVENDTQCQIADLVYALSSFKGLGRDQLSFTTGDKICILTKTNDDWWWGEKDGCQGYVPVNHLTYTSTQEIFWQDQEYFGNYGNLKLHHEMLSDRPRNLCYQKAIQRNAEYLKNKVVLDVGCGSGILSLMCAKYGNPKKVYAVEASDMAEKTEGVVRDNGFEDIICVKHSYIEDTQLDDEVDLIISEWMGTILLFEMMIESVIIARDKFLKSEGVMWPSPASLYLVPCMAHDKHKELVHFWDNQYGFDFSSLKGPASSEFFDKPYHNYVLQRDQCLATETKLFSLDLHTVVIGDLEKITQQFEFHITKDGQLHGFSTWFQTDFRGLGSGVKMTILNTGPDYDLTHWKQNLFLLDNPLDVKSKDRLEGVATLTRHPEWRRHLRLRLKFDHITSETNQTESHEKEFLVWR